MSEENSRAREIGERAGAEAQGFLPTIGDLIEGFWDGLWLLERDGTSEAYVNAYTAGAFVPEALGAIWNFLTGFIDGLFG